MPMVIHPTVTARKKLYDEIGNFGEQYKIAMDYYWLSRVHKAGYKGCYCEALVGNMTLCGVSDSNFKKAYKEVMVISVQNGYPFFKAYLRYFYKYFKSYIRNLIENNLPENVSIKLRGILNKTIVIESGQ